MRYVVPCLAALALTLSAPLAFAQEPDIAKMVESLSSKDLAVRAQALDDLAHAGSKGKAAFSAILKALGDESKDVRWRAARTLGGLGPDSAGAVGPLSAALRDEDPFVRAYAAYALGAIGEMAATAAPDLIKAAADSNEMVRRAVFRALFKIKAPREVTAPLIVKLLEQADPTMVSAIIRSFAELGEAAVPRLNESLKDDRTVYWAALALREIGPKAKDAVLPLADVLKKHTEPEVRMQAALALGAIGPAAKGAVPTLAATLETDEFAGAKFAAAYALGEIGTKEGALAALDKAALGTDPFLAMISAFSAARLEPESKPRVTKAINLILEGLRSKDAKHRAAAARAMVEFKGQMAAVAPALVVALRDSSREVVGNAMEALSAGGAASVPAVANGLAHKDLRDFATRILSRIGPDAKAAVPELVKALADNDPEFKREVQFTLGSIGPDSAPAVAELIKSLASEDETVRNSAIYALGKIGPAAKEALPALRKNVTSEDRPLKRASIWAMLKIDRGNIPLARAAVPLLAEGLSHELEIVRYEAAVALGEIGEMAQPAVPALKKALEDQSLHVRDAVTEALKKIEK